MIKVTIVKKISEIILFIKPLQSLFKIEFKDDS